MFDFEQVNTPQSNNILKISVNPILYNMVDNDDFEYKISLKDVLIIVLTGLCIPTSDVATDYILAGTLIYPQYCFEYSWPEYANKFGYDPNKCK